MKSLRTISSAFLIFSFLISIVHAEPRTALLMGVGDYKDTRFPSLPGIDQDLKRMKTALEKTGFEVTVLANPNITEATKAVDAFGATLKQQKGVGLFYFSGHGGELEGQNYLIPKGARISDNQDIRIQALAARRVLSRMESSGARVNLMFLDACRNDMTKASTQSGLAPMNVKGTFIGFATGTDKFANAGQQGSPYTSVLADMITRPGLSVSDMHTLVNARVQEDTKDAPTGQQVPFQYSGLNSLFYFVPGAPVRPIPAAPAPQIAATKEKPFANSLGMKFAPVKITGGPTDEKNILFSIWETRRMDYEAYSKDVSGVDDKWKSAEGNEALHPVVNVSWEDATAFCAWLTRKERAEGKIGPKDEYRLPSDHEWSCAIGIGSKENAGTSPKDKSQKLPGYPWGNSWPPPNGAGNFDSRNAGYSDAYDRTAPVGSFRVDQNGLYDLSGNVYEWCLDWYSSGQKYRLLRGGPWNYSSEINLRSSYRDLSTPRYRDDLRGFRCVLSVG